MTWLSEIETDNAVIRYEADLKDDYETPCERMTRVIREQSEILGSIYHHYENVGDAPISHWIEAIEDMSPDAKEVIDDCTDPRST